jgi:hypothetical protein
VRPDGTVSDSETHEDAAFVVLTILCSRSSSEQSSVKTSQRLWSEPALLASESASSSVAMKMAARLSCGGVASKSDRLATSADMLSIAKQRLRGLEAVGWTSVVEVEVSSS